MTGPYYVSAIDAGRTFLMAGPFDTHQDALENVENARLIADGLDPRAWFMAWGTVRIEGSTKLGRLTELNLI